MIGRASRVGSPPASPAANHRGRVWEPFQGSHIRSTFAILLSAAFALAAGWLGWHSVLAGAQPLGDESAYLCAFAATRKGLDPYLACPRFFYLPAFAWLGALAERLLGEPAVRAILRGSILGGSAVVAAIAAAWTRWPARVQVGAAVACMFLPPVAESIEVGNLSPVVAALTLLALSTWSTLPVLAGLLLGAGIVVKPIAVVVLVVMAAVSGRERRRAWLAVSIAVMLVGLATWPWRDRLMALSSFAEVQVQAHHRIALVRVLSTFGLRVPPGLVAGLVAILAALAVRWRAPASSEGRVQRVATVAICASLLATPVVWNHTFVLAFPLLTLALATALRAAREPHAMDRRRSLLDLLLVIIGVLLVLASDASGDLGLEPMSIAGVLPTLLPLLAPGALALYLGTRDHGGRHVWFAGGASSR
jgi:hypothetical protein